MHVLVIPKHAIQLFFYFAIRTRHFHAVNKRPKNASKISMY
jgi:hypothetical protein